MIRFYNNIENEEKFMTIVNNIKKVGDINYEGYDTSDPLDEMNDFIDVVDGLLCNVINVSDSLYCWFQEIYVRWFNDCCSDLSVETINKSFEAAQNGKHYYDAIGILDAKRWDKNLVEYVLNEKDDYALINSKDDYKNFLYKYKVVVECPDGYYKDFIDLWQPFTVVEEDVTDCMKNCVMNNFYENEDGEYVDDDGNVIDVDEEATAYAESWLSELNYEEANIEYYD